MSGTPEARLRVTVSDGTPMRRGGKQDSSPNRRESGASRGSVASFLDTVWRRSSTARNSPRVSPTSKSFARPRAAVLGVLDSRGVTLLMVVVTLFALFGDDIRAAALGNEVDFAFGVVSFVSFCLFAVEWLGNSTCRVGFWLSFYCVLDALATVSMVPDIPWLWDPLTASFDALSTADTGATQALRAGRAARVGSRSGRIVRIVRLLRMVRVAALYRAVLQRLSMPSTPRVVPEEAVRHAPKWRAGLQSPRRGGSDAKGDTAGGSGVGDDGEEKEEHISHIGRKLSDLTTRRVILLVLLVLFSVKLLEPGTCESELAREQAGSIVQLHMLSQVASVTESEFEDAVHEATRSTGRLLYIEVCPPDTECVHTWNTSTLLGWVAATRFRDENGAYSLAGHPDTGWTAGDLLSSPAEVAAEYRVTEYSSFSVSGCYAPDGSRALRFGTCVSRLLVNMREFATASSVMGLGTTSLVVLFITIGALLFTRDAEVLVIAPIDRMVALVQKIAQDPLANMAEVQKAISRRRTLAQSSSFETTMLEVTMLKISGLLQVSFGEAGAGILRRNMTTAGRINTLTRGTKVDAVFGFCDVRQFTDVTECLQEEVLVFVNQIGRIVHGAAHRLHGAANKNVGDAFLMVWKLPPLKARPFKVRLRKVAGSDGSTRLAFRPEGVAPEFGSASDIDTTLLGGDDAVDASSNDGGGGRDRRPSQVRPLSALEVMDEARLVKCKAVRRVSGALRAQDAARSFEHRLKVERQWSVPGGLDAVAGGHDGRQAAARKSTISAVGDSVLRARRRRSEADVVDVEGAGRGWNPEQFFHDLEVEDKQRQHDRKLGAGGDEAAGKDRRRRVSSITPGRNQAVVSRMADNALAAFVKAVVDIRLSNRNGALSQFRDHARITERFGDDYEVRLGFGLHIGWAIEGAIGSQYKIDASYLSPHVNLAARLEAATKQYGVDLLCSGDFVVECSPAARSLLRLVDRVMVKGSAEPMELFTFDIADYPPEPLLGIGHSAVDVNFGTDESWVKLQRSLPEDFVDEFRAGVSAYLRGNWAAACPRLEAALRVRPRDGPCATLLQVMREHGGLSPPGWEGVRQLFEK